jgi:vitamin B12 transporter
MSASLRGRPARARPTHVRPSSEAPARAVGPRLHRAATLLASATLLAAATPSALAAAGQPGADEPPAATVVVTAARVAERIDRTLAEVTVIDRAAIDAAAGRTLAELLATTPGVQSWSNGGHGKLATVSLRSLEGRHTLLLVDGVRLGSATLGTPSWDNLPLDAIERIEIVRGPLSGLYGSDAVGGVVQVFTRRGTRGFVPQAQATLGSLGYRELAAGARFGGELVDGALRVQRREVDGFSATHPGVGSAFNPDRDGFEQSSLSARLGADLGDWRAEASLLRVRGVNRFDDGPGVDTRTRMHNEVLALSLGGPLAAGWRQTLRLTRSTDELDRLASASPWTTLGTVGTVQRQLSWEHQLATPLGTLLALAERVQQEVEAAGVVYDVSQRTIDALALGLNGEAGAFGWQASLRRDRNSQFGHETTGSLAGGWQLTPGLRAVASVGTSFVAPSFNDLYWPGQGNPNLRPERGQHRELALVWREGPLSGRLAYFDNRIRDLIAWAPTPAGPWAPMNVARARVDGLSASLDAALGAWTLAAAVDRIDPVNVADGTRLPRRARESARLGADWRGGGWTLGGSLQAVGSRYDDAANTQRLAGYTTLDLRAERQLARDWALGLRLNNAFDRDYETAFGYHQPGREGYVTLRWTPR